MSIPAVPPGGGGGPSPTNPWAQGEMPPGPPMPLSSPWVQAMIKMFPNVDPGVLSTYAAQLQSNMMSMLNSAIQSDLKKAREAAQKWKEVIQENG